MNNFQEYNLAVEQAKEQQIRAHGEENRKRMQEDGRLKKEVCFYIIYLFGKKNQVKIFESLQLLSILLLKFVFIIV